MKKSVLLVEYDNPTIELIKGLLPEDTFEITVSEDGETAKSILNGQTFDLMISAAMLPKFHGFNLSQYVSNHFPNTKIIIISGIYKGMDYKHQVTTQYKANEFFEKPLDREEFKQRVFELLDLNGMGPTSAPKEEPKKAKESAPEPLNLSSEELFGDIIEDVEKQPTPEVLDLSDKEVISEEDQKAKTIKLDTDIDNKLIRMTKDEGAPVPKKNFKKIEDEISKKLEETISGLGLSSKMQQKPKPKPEPPKETKREPEPPKAVKEKPKPEPKSKPKPEPKPKREPEPKPSLPIKEEVGGYEILGLIARGGMAEIYKAKRKGAKGFEKIIALKKILSGLGEDDKYIEMFVDEAKIVAELSHPNIVQIYDFGMKDDYYFIAMEYIQGRDLRLILRRMAELDKSLPEELALHLIMKVLEALSYAHSATDSKGETLDIVHRDISPPNIMVSFDGNIKLTDFGISKATIKIHQTISGALKGKLLYMSPEQARGEKNIDQRSDIYSAGCILWELLTGEKLFLDSSEMAVLKKVQAGKIIKPSEINNRISPELEKIVLKALQEDREKRYQNASDMAAGIESYLARNYEPLPNPSHMAHFLFNLFKDDTPREDMKIELKTVPIEIKKITRNVVQVEEEETPLPTPETKNQKAEEEIIPDIFEEEDSRAIIVPEELESKEPEIIEKKADDMISEIHLDQLEEAEEEENDVIELENVKEAEPAEEPPDTPEPDSLPEPEAEAELKSGPPSEPESDPEPIDDEPPETQEIPKQSPKTVPMPAMERPIFADMEDEDKGGKKTGIIIGVIIAAVIGLVIILMNTVFKGDETPPSPIKKEIKTTPPKESPSKTISTKESDTKSITSSELTSTEKPITDPIDTQKTPTETQKPVVKETPKPVKKEPVKSVKKQTPKKKTIKKEPKPKPKPVKIEKKEPIKIEKQPIKKPPQTIPDKQTTKETTPIKIEPEKQEPPKVEKPKIKEGQIMSLYMVDIPPVPIFTPKPTVPSHLRRFLRSPQTVRLSFLIDHNGSIETVKFITKAKIKKINSVIRETISKWRYKPATKDQVKVKVWKQMAITVKK